MKILDFLFKEKRILENYSYLTLLRFGKYLIPLIVIPYLLRTIGSELYGLIIFAQSILTYFVLLIDFGFNLIGVREISLNRGNYEKLSKTFCGIILIKAFFFILTVIVIFAGSFFIDVIAENRNLFYLSLWICLYEVIFPKWFFQGIEKMKFLTIVDLIFRSTYLVLVLLFIKGPEDYLLVPVFNGVGVIISGFIGLTIVFKYENILIRLPKISYIKKLLRDSYPVFISKASQFYINLNKVLIGSFIGYSAVSYYEIAEKVVNFAKMPMTIFGQAIFPKTSKEKDIRFLVKSFYLILVVNVFIVIAIFLSSDFIVKFFLGEGSEITNTILSILLISLLPITINTFFSTQSLLVFGYEKKFMRTIIFAGVIYALSITFFYYFNFWTLIGIATLVVLSEYVTSATAVYYNFKLKIIQFNFLEN